MAKHPGTQYRRDIDGLRAFAVIGVILHHAGLSAVAGGYAGVDVFFVISGFLIGGIVVSDRTAGRFSYRNFYARRARRILPALVAVLLVTLPFGWLLMMPDQLRYFGGGALSALAFLSNVWFYNRIDYFNPRAVEDPLIHTWSLGVEEQFYILLPILLLLLLRLGKRVTVVALAALTAASLLWTLRTSADLPLESFYLLHTRAWELLGGVLAALARPRLVALPPTLRGGLATAGLLAVVASLMATPVGVPWPGAWTVLPVLGAVAIMLFGDAPSPARMVLSLPPVVGVGLVSYSAYLWHQPILGFLALEGWHPRSLPAIAAIVAVTLVLAALSWRFVEEPFRRGRLPKRTARLTLGAGIALITAFAVGGHLTKGYPERIPAEVRAVLDWSDIRPPTFEDCIAIRRVGEQMDPERACVHGAPGAVARVAIWGDSHAATLAAPLGEALATQGGAVRELTMSSCQPIPGLVNIGQDRARQCTLQNRAMLEWLVHSDSVDTVILYAFWNSYIRHANFDNGQGDRVDDRLFSLPVGAPVDLNETARLAGIETELTATLTALTAAGKRVIVLMPLPDPGFDVPDVLARKLWREGILDDRLTLPEANFRAYSAPAVRLMTAACAASGATCLDLSSAFCDGTVCLAVDGGKPLFFDANHLSLAGAARIMPALAAAVQP
ncbi:MAG: acyltransferase family protein [Paracoccaceae bacterium]